MRTSDVLSTIEQLPVGAKVNLSSKRVYLLNGDKIEIIRGDKSGTTIPKDEWAQRDQDPSTWLSAKAWVVKLNKKLQQEQKWSIDRAKREALNRENFVAGGPAGYDLFMEVMKEASAASDYGWHPCDVLLGKTEENPLSKYLKNKLGNYRCYIFDNGELIVKQLSTGIRFSNHRGREACMYELFGL